ncbi:MAG: hypothetical protein ACM3XM_08700 [Mycobacterium leprae]
MSVRNSVIAYGGWERALQLTNGQIELVVTLEVGPRIIRFGFPGDVNEFVEYPEDMGQKGESHWRPYGGHRFWYAPEDPVLTYYPDNRPVAVETTPDGAVVTQEAESNTGIQKSIRFLLAADKAAVEVEHRLTNTGSQEWELAPWAMSVMAPGGEALLPHPPYTPHPEGLLPNRTLTLWPYTEMDDARFTWGKRLTRVRQESAAPRQTKIGLTVPTGWVAYHNNGHLFLKRFTHQTGATYPDFGCSAEVYTDPRMLELETLAPMVRLGPGETVTHTERWSLHRLDAAGLTEEQLRERIERL